MKKFLLIMTIIAFLIPSAFAGGSGEKMMDGKGKLKVGLSLPTQREDRWVRDKNTMEAYAKELGIELVIQLADADQAQQAQQVENLLSQGIQVLILAPHDAAASAQLVENAKAEGVPVISYDRLITGTGDLEYYISHDNNRVGEMQGDFLVKEVLKKVGSGKANIMAFAGAPTDNNAKLFYEGAMSKIQPQVDAGKLVIVNGTDRLSRSVDNWVPANAQRMAEDVLTRESKIDGVLAPNDGTAGGIIEALRASGIVGIPITGQDSELAAVKRIVAGEQSMTIYKDTAEVGRKAIDMAIQIAKGEKVSTNAAVNNGVYDVPSVLLDPIVITKANLQILVDGGYAKASDIK